MYFRIDIDRMHLIWSVGDDDIAYAFMRMEGFEFAQCSQGTLTVFRHPMGWERRIRYVSKTREADRLRIGLARRKKVEECNGG